MKRREDDDVTECAVCLWLDDDQAVCADRKCPNTIHRHCSTQCVDCGQYPCPGHTKELEGETYCSGCYALETRGMVVAA
jgi:hypothetical protein